MKQEYADKINSLLQCFHFNKEFLEWNHDYSLQLLRHGVSHLYHFAMLQGENDEDTLAELRNIITAVTEGEVPKPYDLTLISDKSPDIKGKTVMFVNPVAVSVELTPEMLQHLKSSVAAASGGVQRLKQPSLY